MYNNWDLFIQRFELLSKIDLRAYKRPQMERRINSFMDSINVGDYKSFLEILSRNSDIYNKFLEHITINVSEFFRNMDQWVILQKQVLPLLLKEKKKIKAWSAGCSTGEEAYSLAMLCMEKNIDVGDGILASDLDSEVLEKASLGIYSARSAQSLPSNYRDKYFSLEGNYYRINNNVKKKVNFRRQDLLKDTFTKGFDLILCRNVVIYFTEESKKVLYRKFSDCLLTGGVIFIGSTEQIFQCHELGLKPIATFFYQKI